MLVFDEAGHVREKPASFRGKKEKPGLHVNDGSLFVNSIVTPSIFVEAVYAMQRIKHKAKPAALIRRLHLPPYS